MRRYFMKAVKTTRPKFFDTGCIFHDQIVDGKSRRYYFENLSSAERYYADHGQWYKEIFDVAFGMSN